MKRVRDTEKEAAVLRATLKRAQEALLAIEHGGEFCDEAACAVCGSRYFRPHGKTCIVGKALKEIDTVLRASQVTEVGTNGATPRKG